MRFKYVVILVVATIVYLAIGTFTVAVVPGLVVPLHSFGAITAEEQRLKLVLDAQNSVRSGAVALLSGSALGIAGLVAFLTFSYSRRESDRVHRVSQDTLFTNALTALGSDYDATVVGAASMISTLARIRPDLRRSASATLFALLRKKCRMTNPIAATEANRSRAELHDREPVAATALQLLGELPAATTDTVTAGTIFQRCLDGCDFRRVRLASCRYEVVSFVGTYFWDAKLVDVEFVKCILPHSDWLGADLRRVRFVECDVSLADFSRAQRNDVVFDRCTGAPT